MKNKMDILINYINENSKGIVIYDEFESNYYLTNNEKISEYCKNVFAKIIDLHSVDISLNTIYNYLTAKSNVKTINSMYDTLKHCQSVVNNITMDINRQSELARDFFRKIYVSKDVCISEKEIDILIKWCVKSIWKWQNGKHNQLMVILVGKQGNGKTSKIEQLMSPFHDKFAHSGYMCDNKERDLICIKKAFIYWNEGVNLTKSKIADLKNLIDRVHVDIRKPYGKDVESYPSRAVFIGDSNDSLVLNDPSGYRRFLMINVDHVEPDVPYSEEKGYVYNKTSAEILWGYCYNLYLDLEKVLHEYPYTPSEISFIEKKAKDFEIRYSIDEIVQSCVKYSPTREKGFLLKTPTEILTTLNLDKSISEILKGLKNHSVNSAMKKVFGMQDQSASNGKRGYYVKIDTSKFNKNEE